MQDFVVLFNKGVELGMRDSIDHKEKYDEILMSRKWDSVRAVLFELDGIFPIQCAGGFFPETDVAGKKIQSLGREDVRLDAMTIISFAAGGKSYICFCWLEDSDVSCEAFMHTLARLPEDSLVPILGALIMQLSENCHFSPSWYEALPHEGKEWIRVQAHAGVPNIFTGQSFAPPPIHYAGIDYFKGVSIASIKRVS